jgi:hypothetical protein
MKRMANARLDKFDEIIKMSNESADALTDYWKDFALYASLEYWMMVSFLVVPLLILFFKIDNSTFADQIRQVRPDVAW